MVTVRELLEKKANSLSLGWITPGYRVSAGELIHLARMPRLAEERSMVKANLCEHVLY